MQILPSLQPMTRDAARTQTPSQVLAQISTFADILGAEDGDAAEITSLSPVPGHSMAEPAGAGPQGAPFGQRMAAPRTGPVADVSDPQTPAWRGATSSVPPEATRQGADGTSQNSAQARLETVEQRLSDADGVPLRQQQPLPSLPGAPPSMASALAEAGRAHQPEPALRHAASAAPRYFAQRVLEIPAPVAEPRARNVPEVIEAYLPSGHKDIADRADTGAGTMPEAPISRDSGARSGLLQDIQAGIGIEPAPENALRVTPDAESTAALAARAGPVTETERRFPDLQAAVAARHAEPAARGRDISVPGRPEPARPVSDPARVDVVRAVTASPSRPASLAQISPEGTARPVSVPYAEPLPPALSFAHATPLPDASATDPVRLRPASAPVPGSYPVAQPGLERGQASEGVPRTPSVSEGAAPAQREARQERLLWPESSPRAQRPAGQRMDWSPVTQDVPARPHARAEPVAALARMPVATGAAPDLSADARALPQEGVRIARPDATPQPAGQPSRGEGPARVAAGPWVPPVPLADIGLREGGVLRSRHPAAERDTGGDATALASVGRTEQSAAALVPRVPVGAASTSLKLAVQIADGLRLADQRVIRIQLAPEELGRVRILLTPTESGLHVVIQSERPETQDLLRRNAAELARDLGDLGYDGLSLDFSDHGERPNLPNLPGPPVLAGQVTEPEDPARRTLTQHAAHGSSGLDLRI